MILLEIYKEGSSHMAETRASILFFLVPLALIVVGCTIADKDRCVAGYEWSEEFLSCLLVEEDTDSETETESDTGDDDGGTDEDASVEVGLGEECMGPGDCADFQADYCLTSPFAPSDPGYCTIQDCQASDCPSGWQCCDCTGLSWVQACMDDDNATLAATYGCTCE